MKGPIGVLLLLFISSNAYSQPTFNFQKFTIDQELSQNTITAIVQDNIGFLWLGTEYGLNRFDGYSFKHYHHDPSDSTTLSFDFVKSLLVDHHSTLWIGTSQGLSIYDAKND